MAKAFTEKEREEIRRRLQDEGQKQFKEKGLKKVSVRELTQAAGIAQGGFYTFYESKEALLLDCVNRKMTEKINSFTDGTFEQYEEEMRDPVRFLAERFYVTGMHLKDNLVFNNLISDSVNIILGDYDNLEQNSVRAIKELLIRLIDWWKIHGLIVTVDTGGLRAFMKAGAVLFMNEGIIGKEYFPEIFRSFVYENTARYFQVTGSFKP
ncbi:MAG: TetR/AcrR family transcriptional regulator [Lachnospiraceae bacterium]|nr:TetR/AcrR family transcriptional regulator [Lachnospiraceae bacterium]